MTPDIELYRGWAVVQIMGHDMVAGFCDHVLVAGEPMLRVQPPASDPESERPRHRTLSARSIFSLTECTEEEARAATYPPPPHRFRLLEDKSRSEEDEEDQGEEPEADYLDGC